MFTDINRFFIVVALIVVTTACSQKNDARDREQRAGNATPQPSSSNFTAADVAKLKWIEGTWRGMDGDKPFFERYRFENDTAMIVETFSDDTLSTVESTTRYELKNGEFGRTKGERRAVAASITSDAVQFVPVSGGGNAYRFERQADGTWNAVLEWPASSGKPAGQKVYRMERYERP